MSAEHPEIIIIKRIVKHEEEHHGGAWKIAFADFMTAMMAFFLVLWIINATDKSTKTIIARYFNPVKLEDAARSTKGIHSTEKGKPKGKDEPGGTELSQPEAVGTSTESSGKDEPGPKPSVEHARVKAQPPGSSKPSDAQDPAAPRPTMAESELFADPYESLDRIADSAAVTESAEQAPAKSGDGTDVLADPFQPKSQPPAVSNEAQKPAVETPAPRSEALANVRDRDAPKPDAPPAVPTVPTASGDKTAPSADWIGELKGKLGIVGAQPGPAVEIKRTAEGVLISLTDQLNFAMFANGSAEPQARLVKVMDLVASELRGRAGRIVVRGHTDGKPFKSPVYDNWRLSSARAQMGYYMLTRGGVPDDRFRRIEGYGDRQLKDPVHPTAAVNRRLEILLIEPKQ